MSLNNLYQIYVFILLYFGIFVTDNHEQDEPTSTTNDLSPNPFFTNKLTVDLFQFFNSVRSLS